MAKRYLLTALAVLLVAGALGAQQVQVREEVLPNGMKLLLVERHDSPTVSCGWVAKVGSVNEPPGITGISHLFEHMMFKGTKTIGTSDYAKDAEIMAEQDAVRAEMEKEYTLLREKLRRGEISGNIYDPANMTPRLKELRAQLEKLFAAEKQVIVKDELDQIYTKEGGSGLNAFTSEDQTAYFITVPANKLELWFWLESDRLANPVVGDFYSDKVIALAKEYFGRIPRAKTPPPEMITDEMPQIAQKRLEAEADTNPEVEIRFHAVPFDHKDMFAFQLVADLLNRRTGRLYKALVEDEKVAAGEPYGMYR